MIEFFWHTDAWRAAYKLARTTMGLPGEQAAEYADNHWRKAAH